MKRQVGQSVTEYGMIAALIALLVLPGLYLLGGSLGFQLTGFGQSLKLTHPTPQQASQLQAVSSGASTAGATFFSGSTLTYTTANGTVISLPDYPHPISETVNTIGANGTTDLLASRIQSITQQLKDTGEITDEQYNALTALANQGHYVASIERVMEEAATKAINPDEYEDMAVTFDGKEYSINSLRKLIGFSTDTSDPSAVENALFDTRANSEMREFQLLYQAAVDSGAMQDPASRRIVESLAAEIAYLSEVANCTATKILYSSLSPDAMNEKMTSYMTDRDSVGICAEGGSTDSGLHCSG